MTLTTIPSVGTNAEQYKEIWTALLLEEAKNKIFWNPFSGSEGSDSPIIVRNDLLTGKGGVVKIDMFAQLSGAGVSGESTLSGSEEAMAFYQLPVSINSYANAVKFHKLSEQHTIHSLRNTGRMAAANWMAAKIDTAIFGVLNAQTINRIYGGDATAKNDLAAEDVLTCAVIDRAKSKAVDNLIMPVMVDGQPWYILVVSNHQHQNLRADPVWIAAQKDANVRGITNPLFSGAAGFWNGCAVFVHERVERGTNAGSGAVKYAIGHLVGSNAVGWAWAEYPSMIEELVDYGRQYGVGAESMYGTAAAVFNSKAIGHVPVMTAANDPNA